MLYEITRASSGYNDAASPYPGAVRKEVRRGDYMAKVWFLRVSSLKALQQMIANDKHPLVVDKDRITIYDDYIE